MTIIDFIKRQFCKHKHVIETSRTIHSQRIGEDNRIYHTVGTICKNCNTKEYHKETIKWEYGYYAKEEK
ncbi:gp90 [Bacillus phage W.Ph.]|uniref:Gp90 n=1 Tax=Bacillus phage W.Ph. TaxID=764595 RepID=G9B1J1_9CAUD|nr:gp90 [Bacillus phage W.Ph.]ADH03236.1 gp90 [Bacillus phage W.Ph.]